MHFSLQCRLVLPAFFAVAALLGSLTRPGWAQIPPATDAPQPLSPGDSAQKIRLPEGLKWSLVAAEPLVVEPSGLCWDERGLLYVSELHGYNLEGQYDIDELNQTGQLDRVVRRIQATDAAKQKAEHETYGTVRLLSDTNDDGVMDRATVFADQLPPCYGVCPARGGIIAVGAPEITFLADRDGDGVAEVREVLFSGFPVGLLERGMNAPQWGLDGWIYCGAAAGAGTITGPHLKQPVALPRTDYRFRPDGSAIEPVSGINYGYGHALTEADERFVSSIGWPGTYIAPLPWQSLARNPYLAAPSLNDRNVPDRRCYPISQPHPWRARRADDPGFAKYYTDRYGIAETAPNGYLTSACSPLVYLDTAIPGLRGQMLTCEPAQNLIMRTELVRDGLRLVPRRLPEEAQSEFLASADSWFHPIAQAVAPDGSIVIADFYREIIEDYSAIPRYLQQQYGLVKGKDRGRVWRLSAAQPPASPRPDMSSLTTAQLVEELASDRQWRRQTARRLLVERNAQAAVPLIAAQLAANIAGTAATLNWLYTLDGLGGLTSRELWAAKSILVPEIQVHALRLAESRLAGDPRLAEIILAGAEDVEPIVRLQAALSLGELRDARALAALAKLAEESGDEEWMSAAIVSSVPDRGEELIELLATGRSFADGRTLSVMKSLAVVAGSRHDAVMLPRLLRRLTKLPADRTIVVATVLEGLVAGLKRSPPAPFDDRDTAGALAILLAHDVVDVRRLAIVTAGLLRLTESPAMKAAWAAARMTARDRAQDLAERLRAVSLLSVAPPTETGAVAELLVPAEPVELQLAAVRALATANGADLGARLTARYAELSPAVQAAVVEALGERQERLPLLLQLVETGTISASDLSAIRRAQLWDHPDTALRAQARKLLGRTVTASREPVIQKYRAALSSPRDPAQGRVVYEKVCAGCHQLGKLGVAVGPDLDSVRNRPDDSLLLDVLDPNATINPKFRTYIAETKDGRILSGLLASESASSLTLKREKNESDTILRKDLEALAMSPKSIMPEEIEKLLTPADFANLLGFIRGEVGMAAAKVLLFDEEPEFPAGLTEGPATLEITESSPFHGQRALRLTPGQRHSPQVPGWSYKIVEKPGPGEYRYLRFAWKTAGKGVLMELAASGGWPPADQPLRRYFSGENQMPWKATQVSSQAPLEWTVVTVDLWKDFGAFTLTGWGPVAMGGDAWFDQIELLPELER
jgi:putative membrane-bound dehydrogenase-like protein